jgi:pimeloyl-ACP methyl ester carboxylesterase
MSSDGAVSHNGRPNEDHNREADMPTAASKDGTTIAYDREGRGPVVILVNGALGDRKLDRRFKLMTRISERLSPRVTVINYDRRGRGESSEAGPFAVEREVEDIAALIEAEGGRAALFGFSSGGALALRAAGAGIGVAKVAVYEVPFMVDRDEKRPPADYAKRLDDLVGAGDRNGAVKHFMRNAMGMPAPVVTMMRLMPAWKDMAANAHTLPYDWAALDEHNMQGDPLETDEFASITIPALVVYGGKSPANLRKGSEALAAILPDARLRVLEGISHNLKVDAIAPVLEEFLADGLTTADPKGTGSGTAA